MLKSELQPCCRWAEEEEAPLVTHKHGQSFHQTSRELWLQEASQFHCNCFTFLHWLQPSITAC